MEKIAFTRYDSDWNNIFYNEKNLLHTTLGSIIYKIHHVGSTAIPDLLSKPIIDIALESMEYPPINNTKKLLLTIGYEYRGESGVKGRSWFTKGLPRKFNLHYCFKDSEVVKRQIKFRDKLIKNEDLRRKYEEIKIQNSIGKDIDSFEYALSKTSFIEMVINE